MDNLYLKYLPLSFIFLLSNITLCTTINVPGDYNTIQEGINAAQPSDTVLVDDGTYFENINFRGKEIIVASNFIIDGDYTHILNTIIDGSQSTEADTGSCVIFGSAEGQGAKILGFTLTRGTGTSFDFGGGNIYREGGAIILSNSSAIVQYNLIINNEAKIIPGLPGGGGGGISSMFGNPSILNNVIMENTASYAAGMVLNWSAGIVKNNVIYKNTGGGQFGTGGLMVWESDPMTAIIENNTIVENVSQTTAGGLSVQNTSAIIRNNIIWGNQQQTGTQVTGYQTSLFEYCNTEEIYPGQGNISIEPSFSSINFLLDTLSSCIDTGDPDVPFNDIEDPTNPGFALYPSLGGLRNDIGAYGGQGASLFPDFLITGIQEYKDGFHPSSFKLNQNFPNPFNPTTTIKYEIAVRSIISISVFDVLGREILLMVEEDKPAGNYEVEFNATGLPSGIYFYRIQADTFAETKKMILLK
jgi:hypothetical protein